MPIFDSMRQYAYGTRLFAVVRTIASLFSKLPYSRKRACLLPRHRTWHLWCFVAGVQQVRGARVMGF